MRFYSQLFLAFIAIVILSPKTYASHLVGGDGTYSFVRFNPDSTQVTFNFVFTLYKDSNFGAPLNPREEFGIFRQMPDGSWEHVDTRDFDRVGGVQEIPAIDEPCRTEPPSDIVGVQRASYQEQITLDVIDTDYMVVYLRCCRNDGITNMVGDEAGAVIDLIITPLAQRTGNNSPTFNFFPPIFICAGFDLDVDLSCTDEEGDEIIYRFCTPITEGGPDFGGGCSSPEPPPRGCPPPYDEVLYNPGYTETAPMAGNPIVNINPVTGLITGVPEATGLYVVGVCVEEYRDGELLSVMRRDFQFNALTCIKEISASLEADEVIIDNSTGISRPTSILKACGDSLVQFKGLDLNTTIVDYTWQITDPNDELIIDTSGFLVRTLEVYFPELGEYSGILIVRDFEGCIDTAFLSVLRLPDMETAFDYEVLDSCYLGPVQFTDLSTAEQSEIIKWDWNFSNESTSTEKDPLVNFDSRGDKVVTLISEDLNSCIDTAIYEVKYFPPHDRLLTSSPDVPLCYGDSIFFDQRWIKTAGDYSDTLQYIETNCDSVERFLSLSVTEPPFEDNRIDTVLCPGQVIEFFGETYSENGVYMHTTFTRANQCDSIYHFLELEYEVLPQITFSEDFIYVPANKDFSLPIRIIGDYQNTVWVPSEGLSCTDCPFPTLNFDEDNTYTIDLETDDGCHIRDSISIEFKVVPDGYYVPTIINQNTLNGDDGYLFLQTLEIASEDVSYSLKVYDRWGGLMHDGKNLTINDRNEGFSARLAEPGSYVYVMEIEEFFETKSLVGTITVID